ncbi:MAG: hypothetical protein MOGMAGMI_01720 [Candidatus Omnitrophica bacterium]|nr:hypothetical protein [Candidatus Omnitrophota bacterium]
MTPSVRSLLAAGWLLVSAPGIACAAQVVFDTVHADEAAADVAAVLHTDDGQDLLEVSVLVRTASGEVLPASPERFCLVADGELVLPAQLSRISFDRAALTGTAAEELLASIGESYRASAAEAASAPGRQLVVTGSSGASQTGPRSVSGAEVDSVTASAGEGLLAAQRKGEVAGARTTFDLSGLSPEVMVLKFEIGDGDKRSADVALLLPFKITAPPVKSLYVDGAPPAVEPQETAESAPEA